MPRYRATVYVLTGAAAAVDGDAGIRRYVAERAAVSAWLFEAAIRDEYLTDVDTDVWFGPITEKPDL